MNEEFHSPVGRGSRRPFFFRAARLGRSLALPGLVFFAAVLCLRAASVTLQWTDPDPTVTGYDVYYGTLSGTYTNVVDVGDTTNATITGLVVDKLYFFAVTAYNSNGIQSAYSSQVSYRPLVPETNQPPVFVTLSAGPAFSLTMENPPDLFFAVVRSNGDVQFSTNLDGPWETLDNIGAWSPMKIERQSP